MAWTPTDLTSTEFVRTQMRPLDRSNALQTLTQGLTSVQSKLTENRAKLDEVQNLSNGPYSFGTVRAAKRAAQEAAAANDPNAGALQIQYEELNARRIELNAEAAKYLGYVQSGEDAINTYQLGINNLEAAGAVPPGTNQFTPPPGYDSTINPPAQVPDSQNPSNTTTTDTNVENAIPISPDSGEDPYVSNGETTITPEDQLPIDDGSDPYVSNGTTTITPEDQVTIDDGSDPYVSNGNTTIEQVNPDAEGGGGGTTRGISAALINTQSQATQQDSTNAYSQGDWRVRLSLAPGSKYLYNNKGKEGILLPLKATQGVLFPYTPNISVAYAASYDATELTHSNYKMFQYKNSSVDNISITCDFTAQDTFEANYLLAVIHFFRSVTKMFYGQDQNPVNGTPPPLCYLTGMGAFQFDRHPLAITSFSMSLPQEVDYIRAGSTTAVPGANQQGQNVKYDGVSTSESRLGGGIGAGGTNPAPVFQQSPSGSREATYVPTKMQIQVSAIPIVSRNDISNRFSLAEYGTGSLLRGSRNKGAGIW